MADHFTALPLELLRETTKDLCLLDRLNLRSVFKKDQQTTIIDLIGSALKILYVAPTKNSLARFKRLCESEFFRHQIETVVFLNVQLQYPEQSDVYDPSLRDFSHFRNTWCRGQHLHLARQTYDIYWNLIEEHEGETPTCKDIVEAGARKLTKLSSVALQMRIEEDGLNADALFYQPDYAHARQLKGLFNLESRQFRVIQELRSTHLYGLPVQSFAPGFFHTAPQNITTLRIDVMQIWDGFEGRNLERDLRSVTSKLERLTITCCATVAPEHCADQCAGWTRLARSATRLKQLTFHGLGGYNYNTFTIIDHF